MAVYQCARVSELLAAGLVDVDHFDLLLDEVIDLYVTAAEDDCGAIELN